MFQASRVVLGEMAIVSADSDFEHVSALVFGGQAVPLYGTAAGTIFSVVPENPNSGKLRTAAHQLGRSGVTNAPVDVPGELTGSNAARVILEKIATCRRVGVVSKEADWLLSLAETAAQNALQTV